MEFLLSFEEPDACPATVPLRVTWTRVTRVGRVSGRAVGVVVGSSARPVILIHYAPSTPKYRWVVPKYRWVTLKYRW